MLTQPKLLIGLVSKQTGVPIKTIRYYEELGLLRSTSRTEGGFRVFDPDIFARLSFIKRSQCLGLSLSEIGEILAVHDQGSLPCDQVKARLRKKLVEIDRQMQQLALLKQELQEMLADKQPSALADAAICPLIESKPPSSVSGF
ncbi:MAG: heavy metal-responsive transcriptional regulator [Pegethrix bostrychoides GSE-TBD4-15B]|jgi:DNA-binding transcriptional MerR regulator|uniref:Heavy metal-responsive transcriptional regulator n=1 Tax=Pegethrix bostrychoides GSE-TBD4-15B TaxID=2839662 RepID=A0A951U560_9CYAN|nr:heavy metal-responsive transcriptional regulator [Pegethrix bostrychoides GSE-TBD4-15B]